MYTKRPILFENYLEIPNFVHLKFVQFTLYLYFLLNETRFELKTGVLYINKNATKVSFIYLL
jgi:hypothetical protein